MTHQFMESLVQPQLMVFTQSIDYNENECYFENFLLNLESEYATQQERNWISYWNRQGYDLILHNWKLKYNDYIVLNAEEKDIEPTGKESTNQEAEKQSSIHASEALTEQNTLWQLLWEEHAEEIYSMQYSFFDYIFYNYFLEFKSSLQNQITNTYELVEEELQPDYIESEDSISFEFKQLQLLGLPTQFGRTQAGSHNSKKNHPKKHADILKHNSAFNSDNEEEEESEEEKLSEEEFETVTESSSMSAEDDYSQQLHTLQVPAVMKAKNKTNRKWRKIPAFILKEKNTLLKYWRKRFSLFSRFDEGIRLDRESWFSVTPEKIAIHLAERLACDTLVDGFCGCGGNAIQFAKTCKHVIAIDIDPQKIEMAKHNAAVYGVAERIDFIVGDFFHFVERLRADVVFLSPPWGGPKYKSKKDYDVEKFLLPVGATELVTKARCMSLNIALFLPRNSNIQQLVKIAGIGKRCEVEHNYLDTRLVGITALYGDAILQAAESDNGAKIVA